MKKHMRLSVHGGYKPGVAGTEIWNFNLRQALVFGSVDDVGLFPDNWEVVANFSTHTEADWTTETTWTGDGPLTASFDPESYLTDYVGPTLQAYAAAGGFSSRTTWLGANLYPCDTTGNAIGGNYARLTFTTELDGGASGTMLPIENSLVASWETHKIGRRGRGRIYPPVVTTTALSGDGFAGSTFVTSYMDANKALITGLSYSGAGGTAPRVRSVVTGPSSSGGVGSYSGYATILGVRVGQIFDTQRKRRNKENESYQEESLTQV